MSAIGGSRVTSRGTSDVRQRRTIAGRRAPSPSRSSASFFESARSGARCHRMAWRLDDRRRRLAGLEIVKACNMAYDMRGSKRPSAGSSLARPPQGSSAGRRPPRHRPLQPPVATVRICTFGVRRGSRVRPAVVSGGLAASCVLDAVNCQFRGFGCRLLRIRRGRRRRSPRLSRVSRHRHNSPVSDEVFALAERKRRVAFQIPGALSATISAGARTPRALGSRPGSSRL